MPGYELKMNSYDLGVDIELYDAVQRLRFEHPEVRAVVLTGGKDRMFCAGANIRMLAQSSHALKVNFCKFTNETRNGIEDSTACSGQAYIAALNGTAAGGGYELALACDQILLVDDGSSAVALPEVPLLGVLPGTGGLTRLVDKRGVRRDRADVFATTAEGIKGAKAVDWRLVDEIAPAARLRGGGRRLAHRRAAGRSAPAGRRADGVALTPLRRSVDGDVTRYDHLRVEIDRRAGTADSHHRRAGRGTARSLHGAACRRGRAAGRWPRRASSTTRSCGCGSTSRPSAPGCWSPRAIRLPLLATGALLLEHRADWLVNEIIQYWKRTLRRLDTTSRSLIALIDARQLLRRAAARGRAGRGPAVHAGRRLRGRREPGTARRDPAGRVQHRAAAGQQRPEQAGRSGSPAARRAAKAAAAAAGHDLAAADAARLGLVTETPDDLDWADEVRLVVEERASFSPDALTGMEANFRFAGPETPETKIFGRLTAWQNWIFQRPNAAGPNGALSRYGTGQRADYDQEASLRMAATADWEEAGGAAAEGEIVGAAPAPDGPVSVIDYNERIPNNVGLATDRKLQRALQAWQPKFLDWWGNLRAIGPDQGCLPAHGHRGRPGRLGQLRQGPDGAVPVGHLPFRAQPGPDDRVRPAPGRVCLAGGARRVPRPTCGGCLWCRATPSPPRSSSSGISAMTAPSLYDMRNLFQVNVEEGRHLWAMVYLLHAYFGRDGREEAEQLLQRNSGDADKPEDPRRVQRADHRLAVVLHVHLLHRPGRQVPARHAEGERLRPAGADLRVHAQGRGAPHVRRHHRRAADGRAHRGAAG